MSAKSNKPCVLVVDDDKALLELIQINLQSEYDVVLAEGGVNALSKLKTCTPDVVVLDLAMPEVDGFSVLGKIKLDPKTNHIPVVILTAMESSENQAKCVKLGVRRFLVKPFEFEELSNAINSILSS